MVQRILVTLAAGIALVAIATRVAAAGGAKAPPAHFTMDSVATAVVVDANDPEKLGRVKVRFPWLPSGGDHTATEWARIVLPLQGADRGFVTLPEVGDEVLIAFEHGDIHHPYILGQVWNGR